MIFFYKIINNEFLNCSCQYIYLLNVQLEPSGNFLICAVTFGAFLDPNLGRIYSRYFTPGVVLIQTHTSLLAAFMTFSPMILLEFTTSEHSLDT